MKRELVDIQQVFLANLNKAVHPAQRSCEIFFRQLYLPCRLGGKAFMMRVAATRTSHNGGTA